MLVNRHAGDQKLSEMNREELEIKSENIHFSLPMHILHECDSYDFSINNNVNIEKYEALSNSVHKQMIEKIELHSFSDDDTIEISLYPATLGKVKVKCFTKDNERVIIHVSAEKLSTLSLLQNNAQELKDVLSKHEFPQDAELKFDMQKQNEQQQPR